MLERQASGTSNLNPGPIQFDGVVVLSATMARDRDVLGDKVGAWIAAHPETELVDVVVAQSSDSAFHCVTIVLFYRMRAVAAAARPPTRRVPRIA